MSVSETLAQAARAGVTLWTDGEAIRWEPRGPLGGPLREAVRAHKPELLAILPGKPPDPHAHSPPR